MSGNSSVPSVSGVSALLLLATVYQLCNKQRPTGSTSSSSSTAGQNSTNTNTSTSSSSSSQSSSVSGSSKQQHHIRPFVICGPSGVGKGTLLARLLSDYPTIFGRSVSHTTRKPRTGETNGTSYHFVTKPDFERDIAKGNVFIEHALIHGNIYGQSIAAVEAVSAKGIVCILEIDVQGAVSVGKTQLNPFYLFIMPPNQEALKERLVRRGSENDDTMIARMQTAEKELKFYAEHPQMWHATLVNEDLDTCYQQLLDTLAKLYPHFAEHRAKQKK